MGCVECTTSDASFFKVHRGWNSVTIARSGNWQLRKNIYSLRDLHKLMKESNERYLA